MDKFESFDIMIRFYEIDKFIAILSKFYYKPSQFGDLDLFKLCYFVDKILLSHELTVV
jgi:hypothetical protein